MPTPMGRKRVFIHVCMYLQHNSRGVPLQPAQQVRVRRGRRVLAETVNAPPRLAQVLRAFAKLTVAAQRRLERLGKEN